MKIAAAAYKPEWHENWASLEVKLDAWVQDAASQGAQLLVFPEYAGLEAVLIGAPKDRDPLAWTRACADIQGDFIALNQALAKKYNLHILAGSLPWRANDLTTNMVALCGPDGASEFQHKLILTPYERDEMGLSAGKELCLFDTRLGKIGVLICYDSEFPLFARALAEAGADMILVPSNTDFPAGQTRVRQSCRARAIEQQCLIVQAPLVGDVPECTVLDTQTGRAALFCPPDHGLPSNGIIAQGETDTSAWVIADVDPKAIAAPRQSGQVGNFIHWVEQDQRVKTVTTVRV
ncbi:MAG: carbon-nitrogen hydrolase family protein [Octadecabacter sp.]|nr:carbon-nitrogen hydrolase family protein [Octadecabacter sp.]